jgi:RimJ/RimL family protein N-acetyltransferase
MLKRMEERPEVAGWGGLIVHKADRMLIGDMGFHSPPDETGTVEIGYSIVPAYHNAGYATEMAARVVAWASEQAEIKWVIAECRVDNIGSIRVLEKIGMRRLGEEEGMFKWEMQV